MPELQKVIHDLAAGGMSDARMAELLRSAAMLPQTLDVAMRSGMCDEQMAIAMCHSWTQETILFAASTGLPDSQMARALGHAALRADACMHTVWKIMMGNKAWPEKRTLMMLLVSKDMRDLVKEVQPKAWVSWKAIFCCSKRKDPNKIVWDAFWRSHAMGPLEPFFTERHRKVEFVLRQLARLALEVKITQLRIPHAKMKSLHFLRLVTQGLFSCRNLEMLNLRDTGVGRGRGAQFLAKVLPFMQRLQNINLSRNHIDAHGANCLTDGLGKCTSLEILNLNNNEIFRDQEANELLSDRIMCNLHTCVKLRRLCLRSNGVTGMQIERIVAYQSELTQGYRFITDLNLAYCDFDRGGVELIGLLAMVSPLEQLNLCECDLRNAGVIHLARLLSASAATTRLTDLILSVNKITDQGARSLARALSTCVSMRCLDLSGNKIRMGGARALAAASGTCTTLTHLLLNNNDFQGPMTFPSTSAVEFTDFFDAPRVLNKGMKD